MPFSFLLFEFVFELVKECFALCVVLFTEGLFVVTELFFLLFGQIAWNFNCYTNVVVAVVVSVYLLYALASQAEHCACLCTLRHCVFYLAVNCRNCYLVTESSLCISKRYLCPYVIAVTFENRVRSNCNVDVQVAVRTSVYTAVALTAYSKCLTIVDASRNVYLLFRYLLYSALTIAGMARVVDYLTLTATATASRGLSDVSERRSLCYPYCTGAVAVRTGLRRRTCGCACAVTVRTFFGSVYANFHSLALAGFHEVKNNVRPYILATSWCVRVSRTSATKASAKSTENGIENIAHIAKSAEASCTCSTACAVVRVYACVTKLVISCSFIFI